MSDDISYEEHVQKNNQRLISIRNSLSDVISFHSACTELTQWCSDQRAFSNYFEDNLMLALQVAAENGAKEGFDFTLAHQLITTCFSHRKLLSKISASRINRWYEQFRRMKKTGGRKKKRGEAAVVPSASSSSSSSIPPTYQADQPNMDNSMDNNGSMWNQGGPMAGPSPMQSPAFGPGPSGPMVPMHGYGMQPSAYPPMDPSGNRPYPPGPDPNGMYDPTQMHMMHQRQQHHQAIMQHQPLSQLPQPAQQMMPQPQLSQPPQPPVTTKKKTSAAKRRAAAAAVAAANETATQQQMMGGGMPPMPQGPGGYDPMFSVPMGANSVPGQVQPLMRVQPGMPSPAYPGVPGPMMGPPRGHMMPMTSPGYPQGNTQMIRAGPPQLFGQMQQPIQQQQVISCLNPNMSFPITFVCRAVEEILAPFCLPHDKNICHEFFDISPETMKKLQGASMELQLKCCLKDDTKKQAPSWPLSKSGAMEPTVAIRLNETPIQITSMNQTIPLKNLVKLGRNLIEFQSFQCICSHCFSIRVVAQIPLNSVVENSLTKANRAGYNADFFKRKLMQSMSPAGVNISLVFDRKRMAIPARFANCSHTACFDLHHLLQSQAECFQLECPICSLNGTYEDIEVDHYIGQVIRETNSMKPQPSDICLHPNGAYRAVGPPQDLTTPMGNPNEMNMNNRKRPNDDHAGGTVLKRNKSESFHHMMKQDVPPTSSPYGNANSVPVGPPMGTSPNSLLSPFGPNASGYSPVKPVTSPMTAKFMGGPGTPLTPGNGLMEQKPAMISNEAQLHGNSPHQSQIQQHGSVETPSLTAPEQHCANVMSLAPASLDIDVVDGLISTQIISTDDFRKYLCDGDSSFVDVPEMKEASGYGWSNDTWDDFKQLVSDGRI
ncbi:unnamed protein product [Auanema sp. JU1783]|nr:unnamed protein product [Auanema sp. JU1783]